MYKQLEKGNKKNAGKIRMMKKGGSVKNAKPMTLAQVRAAAKKKGYKLVKA
jgi:hypothetical protein